MPITACQSMSAGWSPAATIGTSSNRAANARPSAVPRHCPRTPSTSASSGSLSRGSCRQPADRESELSDDLNRVLRPGCRRTPAGRFDRLSPAWRTKARRQIGQWSEHEEALPRLRVGNLQPAPVRPFDADSMPAEDEQVEVDLARTPALAGLAADGLFKILEYREQRDFADLPAGTSRHVE